MENKPIHIYYETKIPFFVILGLFIAGCVYGLVKIGGDYLMNPFFYFTCILVVMLLFLVLYRTSSFHIYDNKLVIKKGSHIIETPWNEVVGIHYDYAPNIWYILRGFKSNDFFLETKQGFTKYANEWNIRKDSYTFRSRSKDLIADIKQRSGASEDVGAVSGFKQKQNMVVIVFLICAIVLIGLGGLWYADRMTQQEIDSIPHITINP